MTLQNSCKNQETFVQIKTVTAITEVFCDGQKVVAVAIEYDVAIKNASLSAEDFSVEGRTITKIYANRSAEKSDTGKDGKFVIIELSPKDKNASTFMQSGRQFITKPAKISVKQFRRIENADGKIDEPFAGAVTNDRQTNWVVDDFKQLKYSDAKMGRKLKYNLFVPENYDKNKLYPLVMFIHDAGVLSTDRSVNGMYVINRP